MKKNRRNVIIMGAAGRDFHNFNMFFRKNPGYNVRAFTAEQIPNIDNRRYPAKLAGRLYPRGIPIHPERDLAKLIEKLGIDTICFAYSDIPHVDVMHRASLVHAAGASFMMLGPKETELVSSKKVISVLAVRTGCGKSEVSRKVMEYVKASGRRIVAVRHPMPYGNLTMQEVQRFAKLSDIDKQKCTIEEREEYEPHVKAENIVYAGVDYEKILRSAEKEADIVLFDGGNNDFSFYRPDLNIVLVDPHRPGHEMSYHPGETNLRSADIIIVNKVHTAKKKGINTVIRNAKTYNPKAKIIKTASEIMVSDPSAIRGKKCIVVEDGPTVTHGGMSYGAGFIAVHKYGGKVIDPRSYAVGEIRQTMKKFSHLKEVVPAMGYSKSQIKDLQSTLRKAKADVVVDGSPVSLKRLVNINKPIIEVEYELVDIGNQLKKAINSFCRK